jgi:hypothetical protein
MASLPPRNREKPQEKPREIRCRATMRLNNDMPTKFIRPEQSICCRALSKPVAEPTGKRLAPGILITSVLLGLSHIESGSNFEQTVELAFSLSGRRCCAMLCDGTRQDKWEASNTVIRTRETSSRHASNKSSRCRRMWMWRNGR